jgi:hypothetical protein
MLEPIAMNTINLNGTNVVPTGAGYGILPFQVVDPLQNNDWLMESLDNGSAGSPSISVMWGDPNGLTLDQFQVNTASAVGWIFDKTNGLCLSVDGGETLTTLIDNFGNIKGGGGSSFVPMGARLDPGAPAFVLINDVNEWCNVLYAAMVTSGWINDSLP